MDNPALDFETEADLLLDLDRDLSLLSLVLDVDLERDLERDLDRVLDLDQVLERDLDGRRNRSRVCTEGDDLDRGGVRLRGLSSLCCA